MYPRFPSRLVTFHMLVVLAVVLATLLITHNPLALLGLWFMPQVPFMFWGERTNFPPDVETDARSIGFHAPMGDDE